MFSLSSPQWSQHYECSLHARWSISKLGGIFPSWCSLESSTYELLQAKRSIYRWFTQFVPFTFFLESSTYELLQEKQSISHWFTGFVPFTFFLESSTYELLKAKRSISRWFAQFVPSTFFLESSTYELLQAKQSIFRLFTLPIVINIKLNSTLHKHFYSIFLNIMGFQRSIFRYVITFPQLFAYSVQHLTAASIYKVDKNYNLTR